MYNISDYVYVIHIGLVYIYKLGTSPSLFTLFCVALSMSFLIWTE